MKKTIAILLFLIGSVFLFAETGYRGFEWGTSEFLFELKAGENDAVINLDPFKAKVYKTKLLGEERELYYIFYQEYFSAAFYIIPSEVTEKLLNNFDKKNRLAFIQTEKIDFNYDEAIKQNIQNEDASTAKRQVDFIIGLQTISFCAEIEKKADLTKAQNQEAESQLIIYNYNNDTRVYIYKNMFDGKTIVVYYPHEQDY